MSTKAKSLLNGIGDGLADSIGVRAGESTVPIYRQSNGAPPVGDFVRNRSAGDIEVDKVVPDPDQPRKEFDPESIERLARSIKDNGQIQPIRVRWNDTLGKWVIIAGERRWRATKAAGLPKISCIFIDRELTENEIRSEQMIENLLREDLKPIEGAKGFKVLMEINSWNAKQLATSLHVSPGTVSKSLSLLKLPEDLQQKVDDGTLSPSTAYQVAKVKDEQTQRQLADKAMNGEATQRDTEASVRQRSGKVTRVRKTTNETFRTTDNVKIVVSCRRDIGDAGVLDALLTVAEEVRRRMKDEKKAA